MNIDDGEGLLEFEFLLCRHIQKTQTPDFPRESPGGRPKNRRMGLIWDCRVIFDFSSLDARGGIGCALAFKMAFDPRLQ